MRDAYLLKSKDVVRTIAQAVTAFYLDYYKKTIEVLDARDGIPWDELDDDVRVYIVGWTPDAATMRRLMDEVGDIVWIDDDREAVEALEGESDELHDFKRLKALRKPGMGLVELAWNSYFAWMKNRPIAIDLMGVYERDDREDERYADAVAFYRGMQGRNIEPTDPEVFSSFWKEIVCIRRDPIREREIVDEVIAAGREE